MSDKEFLERMLSILPEEFQDIYDDTIPEAKEVRKKMGKKTSSAPSYSCAMPMLDDIRSLDYKEQAKVCKAFHQYLAKNPLVITFFTRRFEETYSHINMRNPDATIEWIRNTVNDMDNAISEIDNDDPMVFFELANTLGKVIAKNKGKQSL